MQDTDREWVRSELLGMESQIKKRVHDLADNVQAVMTWKEVHTMERNMRSEALLAQMGRVEKHLIEQDAATAALTAALGKQVNRWGGAIALGLVLVPIALWVATNWKK